LREGFRLAFRIVVIITFYSHINLNNGKKKNERLQVQASQPAAKIHLSQVVHHWTAINSWGNAYIIQAAYNAGIHYSTAKTILFFHKKNYKNYSSYHVEDPNIEQQDRSDAKHASYKAITIDLDESIRKKSAIEIIVNSKEKERNSSKSKYHTIKRKKLMFSDE